MSFPEQHRLDGFPAAFGKRYVLDAIVRVCIILGYVCMVITYSKGKDQLGKVVNPARRQLNRENEVPVCA